MLSFPALYQLLPEISTIHPPMPRHAWKTLCIWQEVFQDRSSLEGGGNWSHPAEINLSHHSVLFLDELPEFGVRMLKVLYPPVEDKVVTISRVPG